MIIDDPEYSLLLNAVIVQCSQLLLGKSYINKIRNSSILRFMKYRNDLRQNKSYFFLKIISNPHYTLLHATNLSLHITDISLHAPNLTLQPLHVMCIKRSETTFFRRVVTVIVDFTASLQRGFRTILVDV